MQEVHGNIAGIRDTQLAQHKVVEQVLAEIGADTQPRLDVINKCDLCPPESEGGVPPLPGAIRISAKTGENVDGLLQAIAAQLRGAERKLRLLVPFDQFGALNDLRSKGRIVSEEYQDTGVAVTVMAKGDGAGQISAHYASLLLPDEE